MDTTVAASRSNDKINRRRIFPPRTRLTTKVPLSERKTFESGSWCRHSKEAAPYLFALPPSRTLVYLYLEEHANNETQEVWGRPALQVSIMVATGLSMRTVKSALEDLEESLIASERRGRRDVYTLCRPWQNKEVNCRKGAKFAPPLIELDSPKPKDIKPPARGAEINIPSPAPARPRNRHIATAGRLGGKFCDERHIVGFARQPITQSFEDRLNAGESEEAIVADLDREYRARLEAAEKPHRSPYRNSSSRRRREAEERMARDNYTITYHGPKLTEEENAALEAFWQDRERRGNERRLAEVAAAKEAKEKQRTAEAARKWAEFDWRIANYGGWTINGMICKTDEDFLRAIPGLLSR